MAEGGIDGGFTNSRRQEEMRETEEACGAFGGRNNGSGRILCVRCIAKDEIGLRHGGPTCLGLKHVMVW